MVKSANTALNRRIEAWAKRGAAFTLDGLNLIHDAVVVAYGNGNIDPMKRIVAALDKSDAQDAITIFGHVFPVVVSEGELSVVKGWQKKLEKMPRVGEVVQGYKSFRTLAAALRPEKDKTEKPFDMAAYLKGLDKLNAKAKEGNVPADLVKRMEALVQMIKDAAEGDMAHAEDSAKVVAIR